MFLSVSRCCSPSRGLSLCTARLALITTHIMPFLSFSQLSVLVLLLCSFPPLTLFNSICLHASSISSRCLISKREKIAKRDWPAMYKMFSLCLLRMSASAVWALWRPSFQALSFNSLSPCNTEPFWRLLSFALHVYLSFLFPYKLLCFSSPH